MAKAVCGVFKDASQAEQAVKQLVRRGFPQERLTVRSSEPFLDQYLPHPAHQEKTRIALFALVGGLLGAVAGFSFAAATFHWMALPTGGMPIVPLGPASIVTFEVTALGAILGTFLSLLVESGLSWRRRVEDTAGLAETIADGGLLLSVQLGTDEEAAFLTSLLSEMGAEKVASL